MITATCSNKFFLSLIQNWHLRFFLDSTDSESQGKQMFSLNFLVWQNLMHDAPGLLTLSNHAKTKIYFTQLLSAFEPKKKYSKL